MKSKAKLLALGFVLGALASFPLGVNFGRDEPLMSNPLGKGDLHEQVVERVKNEADDAIEGARERIHKATRPVAQAD